MQEQMALLQKLEERIAYLVCGSGIVSKAEADQLWKLREQVGKKWDAINRRWQELDD